MKKRCIFNNNFINSKKSQMHVVMAIMLIAILLATVVFFWRTSEDFSQSYSKSIDEKSFQNIATYIENTVAHNEIAWIERTLVQTNMVIPLTNDGQKYIGENELFKVIFIDSNKIKVYPKNKNGTIKEESGKEVLLNTRFYVDIDISGDYNIYSNPAIPGLKDKNIIGDFFLFKIEPMVSGRGQEYVVYLTPTFKSAVIGDAGQPPESLAKTCFLLEYPKSYWSQYYNSEENSYSVYPSNYFILNSKEDGIDSRYINYYTNIFIPSNSDMIESLSANPTKDVLNNYIKSGGSLIMLSQNLTQKTRYDFLPVNITFDSGKYDTIGVSKQHNITLNIDTYEIAGSYYSANGTILDPFVDGPANEILLREIPYGPYLNNNPSLIVSTWGSGKVVTTTIPMDIHSIVDNKFNVCPWWDPGQLGNPPDWHFRKRLEVNPGNTIRINEPIEIIIDPTVDINRLAKQGFLNLENATLDFDSIRVIELINGNCEQKIEVPSQTYPYRPNMQAAGYRNSPLEFHEHTIFFELDSPIDILIEMEVPVGSQYKDENPSINTDIRVFINDVLVTDVIQGGNTPLAGYWNPFDGGQSDGPRSFSCTLPAKYFNKGDNKIRLSMENPNNKVLTWYQNVLFRLYERTPSGNNLFFREYPPVYVYFSMGASPSNNQSRTIPETKRTYDIYFDIEENGKKSVPAYRNTDNSLTEHWSVLVDSPVIFSNSVEGNLNSEYFPVLMNNSSPSTGDVDNSSVIDVVIGMRNGNVRSIRGTDGATIWERNVVNLIAEYRSGNTVYLHAPVGVSSPAICDLNNDGILEIVTGGGNLLATFPRTGASRTITVGTDSCVVSIINAATGDILWTFPIDGAMLSAPIIADIDNDGYDDIIVVDTVFSLPYSINQNHFGNNNISIRNNIYAYSGQTRQRIFKISGTQMNISPRLFAYRLSSSPYTPYIMIPSTSPAVEDISGDGRLDIVWTSVDGNVYLIEGGTWNNRVLNNFSIPNITPSMPLGYIISSPVIAQTDYFKDYKDILVSVIQNDLVRSYIIDGRTGALTQLNIQSNSNDLISGHPVAHSPNGFHLRGPQMIVPGGQYLMIQHLDLTHQVRGRITQTTSLTSSYATPVIVEVNNYSTYQKKYDAFFFDCVLGAENGNLYALAYRDTTQGDDNGDTSPPPNDANKLNKLWEYSTGSPIRGSVAVDDIDNDGKSEIIFMTHDGRVISLNVGYHYTRWNFNRYDLHGTANTLTNLNPVSYTFSEPEAIELGNSLDPYDDKFRLISTFTLGASNKLQAYMSEKWMMIDTNRNNLFSDERVLYEKDLTKFNMNTYEGRPIETTYNIESIYGDVINNNYMITFIDRGMIRLFNNIMAYTSAPTKNIQIEEGIWVNLDIPNTIGTREYIIEGTGTHLTIYDPKNAEVQYTKELRGMSIYGTISSISKNKYVVITSYGAYLSPNPQEG
ncbi:MAG: PQQ-binding-like beta-propeller repeat protein [Candidatus Methanofastidiosum sp.]|nr:PQQ-binding-like beta-propeller repeat protein [Methanofastidiosum sp.]